MLIPESLDNDHGIWDLVEVTGRSKRRLEREGSRGEFTFCNVEVSDREVDSLMREVAERLRSPGWYFHVERDRVMEMKADDAGSRPPVNTGNRSEYTRSNSASSDSWAIRSISSRGDPVAVTLAAVTW